MQPQLAPSLFLAHGSPMNVIEDNLFNANLKKLSQIIDGLEIKAIICISAHYQTQGVNILGIENPKTIYDFYGFPEILYKLKYPAKGSPELSLELKNILSHYDAKVVTNWGLDHGAWNVLYHLIPKAHIPVIMLSLDKKLKFEEHFHLASLLKELRKNGIMILGSGNIVHSFSGIDFSPQASVNPMALEFNQYVKNKINQKSFSELIHFENAIEKSAQFSINSSEHYLPLLYTLGASFDFEKPIIFSDEIIYSTLSMLSVGFGINF